MSETQPKPNDGDLLSTLHATWAALSPQAKQQFRDFLRHEQLKG